MKNFPVHGANPENLFWAFDIEIPEKILDMSTNVNIFPCPSIDLDIKDLISHYPDPDCLKLREKISGLEHEKIPIEKILFTNGINEAIFLLANLFRDKRTGIFQPCYSEYSRAFRNAENIFDVNRAGDFEVFIIVNPNNPTGIFIKNLSGIIKNFPKTFFIIDEAYIYFLINDKPERLINFDNVILLRSLTKFFHLSGARIGYVIASEKIIEGLKTFQPFWSVNAIAQELALRFLEDKKFYEDSRNFYKVNAPKFMNALKASGFEISDSAVNFFLVRVANDVEVIKFLLRHGIVVRHTRNFQGINPSTAEAVPLPLAGAARKETTLTATEPTNKYIRVATRLPEENNFFIEKLIQARNLYPDYF